MKTMCCPDYRHNGFVATDALGHIMGTQKPYTMCPTAYELRSSC